MWMKNTLVICACILGLVTGCSQTKDRQIITITNHLDLPRTEELVEIPLKELHRSILAEDKTWVVLDSEGNQVPYQITYDSLLIFPVRIAAKGTAEYTVAKGIPVPSDTICCGRCYPERLDDIAWENDKAAYRAYGPALQRSGERGFGYDILTKSVSYPVLKERYRKELDPLARKQMKELRESGKHHEADSIGRAISYHIDHGNGMDCYSVGPTLGGGTSALLVDSSLVYPYCYREYQILDNGPLRFTVRLEFNPLTVASDSNVIETRVISLDKGSYLNKTILSYQYLSEPCQLATGIVVHPQNPDGAWIGKDRAIIAYADSTDRVNAGNGVIHVGALLTKSPLWKGVRWFNEQEKQFSPGALGHVMMISDYKPGKPLVYYWGSSWSKSGFSTQEEWVNYLEDYDKFLSSPLEISIK